MKTQAIALALLALCFAALQAADAPRPDKPNIILFLVDDMGWMDSTPYGSEYYETPHMQRLAQQSMRFTNAYALPLCSPTGTSASGIWA
jgi:arylsulfatase A-like enzyme